MSVRFIVAALIAAALVAPAASPALAQSDQDAIKALIQSAYVDGLQNLGDLEKTKAGFHPDFVLLGLRDGTLTRLPIAEWIAAETKATRRRRRSGFRAGLRAPGPARRRAHAPAHPEWIVGREAEDRRGEGTTTCTTRKLPLARLTSDLAQLPPDKRAALQWLRGISRQRPRRRRVHQLRHPGLPSRREAARALRRGGEHCAFYPGAVVEQYAANWRHTTPAREPFDSRRTIRCRQRWSGSS